MTPAPSRRPAVPSTGAAVDAVPRRRPRSGDRGGLPPHPRHRRAARSGRDRVRVRRARRAGLGEGAAPRVAGHARPRHPRRVHASGPRAARPLRLDRDRLLRRPPPPAAAVRRHGRRGGGRGLHRGPGGADCSRAPRPAGAARPTAWRSGACARATRRAPPIRTSRTTTARTRATKAELTAQRSRLDHRARRVDSRAGRRRHGAAAGRRRAPRSTFLERSTARSSALDHRAAAALVDHVGELRALGAFSCSLAEALRFIRERVAVAAGRAGAPASRPSLRLPPVAGRLRRPPASLRRRPRRRPRVSDGDRGSRPARRRARRDLAGAAAVDRPDRRSGVCVLSSGDAGCARRPDRTAARPRRVTFSYSCRDTREFRETYASWLMLQAFRLQQGERDAVLSGDEGGARRAGVRACRANATARVDRRRLVAAQRRRHRRRRRRGRRGRVPGARRADARPRAQRESDAVHRVRRLRARGRARARSVRAAAMRSR